MKKYVVRLSAEERQVLENLMNRERVQPYRRVHAHILLLAGPAKGAPARTDADIAEIVGRTTRTVEHVRQRLVEQGLEAALERRKRKPPAVAPIFDGETEAHLIALACSEPPGGRARWSLRLLADKLVEPEWVDQVSYRTVGRVLKKRIAAAPEPVLVHPAGTKRRLRRRHGGGARPLSTTV